MHPRDPSALALGNKAGNVSAMLAVTRLHVALEDFHPLARLHVRQ
jgi:hypothetical protein